MATEPLRHETYTHGHAPATVRQHGRRTAEEPAAFPLPELRPGMRLLDVGCGPRSITRGLAERVAPGQVIGLDFSRETLAAAREDAAARGLDNLLFQHLGERRSTSRPGIATAASREWGGDSGHSSTAAHPDALWAFVHVEALARKPA